jgi:IMP dehydrogenase
MRPQQKISEALDVMARYRISGVPVTDRDGKLLGSSRTATCASRRALDQPISERMTRPNLVTRPEGTTLDEAKAILHEHRIEKLLVVDKAYRLKGLITVKDIQKVIKYPNACKDEIGRLRVGAAVGVAKDSVERAQALVEARADVLVIDTAHGHSKGVLDMVSRLRELFPKTQLVAGNVGTAEGARALADPGRRRREGRASAPGRSVRRASSPERASRS